jgi:predicted ATPase
MAPRGEQLVGRAAELGSLDGALAELGRQRPCAIELVGEPGIGKTRLLVELGALADERGHTVLSGSASEFERDLPFWVFLDALDDFVGGLQPRALAGLDADVKADAGGVFTSLAADGNRPAAGGPGQDERYRIHRAVRRLLEALAARKPLVLLLDDLHWADAGSIELLAALLRRPPAAPVLTAIALRPRQVPDRLSSALVRAIRDGVLTTVELAALSADDARQLLGPAADATALIEESGGNPFYLQQLARAADRHGAAAGAGAAAALGAIGVPRAVAAALAEELADLPDGPRRVLEGAAVAGDPFEPELAAAAAGMAEADAVVDLDELFARDLVRTTGVPRRFRFRHPLVRRAVLEATPGGWRLGAHERAADALGERGAPA